MKSVLYWDPRFPRRAPQRLILPDTIASALVRAGAAAAADPAEQGVIAGGGGALDPGTPTEIVIENGFPGVSTMIRLTVPLSVAQIAVAAGIAAGLVAIATIIQNVLLAEDGTPVLAESGGLIPLES